ncbi:unnamed protein product [Heligmosomoides polygyrus]|uniref:Uncharacterized protein n=1 Tax=Heligmosomoides polygyrus TaxID=6339 RepID=A0A183GR63_HELPZ|nr:unnamed protein product [Heligmosomoides polygyrus]
MGKWLTSAAEGASSALPALPVSIDRPCAAAARAAALASILRPAGLPSRGPGSAQRSDAHYEGKHQEGPWGLVSTTLTPAASAIFRQYGRGGLLLYSLFDVWYSLLDEDCNKSYELVVCPTGGIG